MIARTPEPPYHAVVFASQRTEGDQGYGAMAERMMGMAKAQPGFLGVESARNAEGFGITVSYWSDLESIRAWKAVVEHRAAQRMGKDRWYGAFSLRVARVERHDFFGDLP
jgi:heme-degrading monooxygenase HmoA